MSKKAWLAGMASLAIAVVIVVAARPLTGLGEPQRLRRALPSVGKGAYGQRVLSTRLRDLQAALGNARDEAERAKLSAKIEFVRKRARDAAREPELDDCERDADCELRGQCGCGVMSLTAFRAVNRSSPRPPPPTCKPCPVEPRMDDADYGYYAVCEQGRCKGVDVRHSPLSSCRDDADCVVRGGTDCCERCSGGLAAVSRAALSSRAFCGGEATECSPCPPRKEAEAHCVAGHCALRLIDE